VNIDELASLILLDVAHKRLFCEPVNIVAKIISKPLKHEVSKSHFRYGMNPHLNYRIPLSFFMTS